MPGIYKSAVYLLLLSALWSMSQAAWSQSDDEAMTRAKEVLQTAPIVDGHNDLPWVIREKFGGDVEQYDISVRAQFDTDIPRLMEGMVGTQFWSVYVPISSYGGAPGDAARVLAQMDVVRRLVERYPEDLELAFTAADVRRAHAAGRVASMMGIEGGHAIEDSLGVLRSLYAAGARYMTLTHSRGLHWADSATDEPRHDGLTEFGEEVVREMNRLGMLVDLSHVTEAVMHDALDVAVAPVIFSHSAARGVTDHPRNVPDSVLERLKKNGGVVMVTFVPGYVLQASADHGQALWGERGRLKAIYPHDEPRRDEGLKTWREANPAPEVTLSDVADHIDHIRDVVGVEHIGLGGDFDGIRSVPVGLEDVSTYPALLEELLRRGYSEADIAAIAGENVLRAMVSAEAVAKKLKATSMASDMRLDVEG
jgi:membrane dipeptidase